MQCRNPITTTAPEGCGSGTVPYMHMSAADREANRFTPCCRPVPRRRSEPLAAAIARERAAYTVRQLRLTSAAGAALARMDADLGALALYVDDHPAKLKGATKRNLEQLARVLNAIDEDLKRCRLRQTDPMLTVEQRRTTVVVRGCEIDQALIDRIQAEFYPLFFTITAAAHNQVAGFDIEWYRERRRRLTDDIEHSRLADGVDEDWLQWVGRVGITKVRRAALASAQWLHQMGSVLRSNHRIFVQHLVANADLLGVGWLLSLCSPGHWIARAWSMFFSGIVAHGGGLVTMVTQVSSLMKVATGSLDRLRRAVVALRSSAIIYKAIVRLLNRLLSSSPAERLQIVDRLKSQTMAAQLRQYVTTQPTAYAAQVGDGGDDFMGMVVDKVVETGVGAGSDIASNVGSAIAIKAATEGIAAAATGDVTRVVAVAADQAVKRGLANGLMFLGSDYGSGYEKRKLCSRWVVSLQEFSSAWCLAVLLGPRLPRPFIQSC